MDRRRGRAVRSRTLGAAPGLPDPRAVQVPLRDRRDRAAVPAARAGARDDGQRSAAVGARRHVHLSARRVLEDLPDRLSRGVPAREAGVARAGAPEGRRPAARDLGRVHARARLVERPRFRPALLRDLPGDAVRRHRAALVRLRRHRAVSRRRCRRLREDPARPRARHDLAASVDDAESVLPVDGRPRVAAGL